MLFYVLFALFTPCGFHIVTCIGKLLQGPGFYVFAFFFPATSDSRRWHITVIYIYIYISGRIAVRRLAPDRVFLRVMFPAFALPPPSPARSGLNRFDSCTLALSGKRDGFSLGRLPVAGILNCDARAQCCFCLAC